MIYVLTLSIYKVQVSAPELQSWVGKGAMSFVPYLGISDVSKLAILHVMACMSNVHVSNCLYSFGFSMPSLTVISFS